MLENEFIINVSKKLNISYKESKDIINIILGMYCRRTNKRW